MAHTTVTTVRKVFLDTNIILARVLEHQRLHNSCKILLKNDHIKFTCENVKSEVDAIVQRWNLYYPKLVNYRQHKKHQTINQYIETIATEKNDIGFLKAIILFLQRKYRGQNWYQMYRYYIQILEKMIDRTFQQEIEDPLIQRAINPAFVSRVNNVIQNRSDSQIIINMIYHFHSSAHPQPLLFTTNDLQDFINHRQSLYLLYQNQFGYPSFFEIVDIHETLARL